MIVFWLIMIFVVLCLIGMKQNEEPITPDDGLTMEERMLKIEMQVFSDAVTYMQNHKKDE